LFNKKPRKGLSIYLDAGLLAFGFLINCCFFAAGFFAAGLLAAGLLAGFLAGIGALSVTTLPGDDLMVTTLGCSTGVVDFGSNVNPVGSDVANASVPSSLYGAAGCAGSWPKPNNFLINDNMMISPCGII
jgi:hypothetical protein